MQKYIYLFVLLFNIHSVDQQSRKQRGIHYLHNQHNNKRKQTNKHANLPRGTKGRQRASSTHTPAKGEPSLFLYTYYFFFAQIPFGGNTSPFSLIVQLQDQMSTKSCCAHEQHSSPSLTALTSSLLATQPSWFQLLAATAAAAATTITAQPVELQYYVREKRLNEQLASQVAIASIAIRLSPSLPVELKTP